MQFSFEVSYPLCFCFVVNLFLLPTCRTHSLDCRDHRAFCRDMTLAHEAAQSNFLNSGASDRSRVFTFESIGRRSEAA